MHTQVWFCLLQSTNIYPSLEVVSGKEVLVFVLKIEGDLSMHKQGQVCTCK